VLVLGVSLLIWSAMTALCGLAPSFAVLLIARLGVGMGEAGGIPTTHALVSDHFPARWRATALSATVVIGGIGFMIANAAGGWVADHWGWRAAFLVGAAPAPLLALLLFTTVREPVPSRPQAGATPTSMWRAVGTLLSRRSYALLCLGMAVATVAASAMLNWIPAFLMRSHGLSAGQVGGSYGLIMGLSTIAAFVSWRWPANNHGLARRPPDERRHSGIGSADAGYGPTAQNGLLCPCAAVPDLSSWLL